MLSSCFVWRKKRLPELAGPGLETSRRKELEQGIRREDGLDDLDLDGLTPAPLSVDVIR